MAKNDGGPAKANGACCRWCSAPAVRKQGRIWLCALHYRFQSMRTRAKRDGKSVPSYDDLLTLLLQLDPPMTCPVCRRKMNWLSADGGSTVVTLQHDRSGVVRLLCLACNTKHAAHPGDTFYDLPAGHKRCGRCEQILPEESFPRDRSRAGGLKAHCKRCSTDEHAKWVKQNRDHVNGKQRERRAARR